MKKILYYLFLGALSMMIILYLAGWDDLIVNKKLTDDLSENLQLSFKDFTAVLFYFRYIILIGSVLLGAVFYGIRIGLNKFK